MRFSKHFTLKSGPTEAMTMIGYHVQKLLYHFWLWVTRHIPQPLRYWTATRAVRAQGRAKAKRSQLEAGRGGQG